MSGANETAVCKPWCGTGNVRDVPADTVDYFGWYDRLFCCEEKRDKYRDERDTGLVALPPSEPAPRDERKYDVGPGFVRAKECPDCSHTRCGEDCNCDCDAAHAEHEVAVLRELLDEAARLIRQNIAVQVSAHREADDDEVAWLARYEKAVKP